MAKKSPDHEPTMTRPEYHGYATFSKTAPAIDVDEFPAVDVVFTFEEAMRLSVAIQSCVNHLNNLNKRVGDQKHAGMQLGFNFKGQTVMVTVANVKPKN